MSYTKGKIITKDEDKTYKDVEEQCDEDIFSSDSDSDDDFDSDSDDDLSRVPEVVTTCPDITPAI